MLESSGPDCLPSRKFWGPGDTELFVLCPPPVHPKKKRALVSFLSFSHIEEKLTLSQFCTIVPAHDEQLFVIPFAKSAVATAHTPVRAPFSSVRYPV